MKVVVAVVMLALAVSVSGSLYAAHIAPAVSYVTAHGAWPYGGWPYGGPKGPAAIAVDYGLGHSGWAPSAWGHGGYPGISLSQGPHGIHAPLALAGPSAHGHGHEGVYVAKTRGAIHTAPLAGHINSATSLNLAPAPGTH